MASEDPEAEAFAAVEVTASLRTVGVNRAKPRGGIEGDTGAVTPLVHATHAIVLDDQFLRDQVVRP